MVSDRTAIGIVTWDFASARGGLGRTLQWLTEDLTLAGFTVCVASPAAGTGRTSTLARTARLPGGQLLFSALLPFALQRWIDREKIGTLIVPVGPGGVFLMQKPLRCRVITVSHHTYWQQSRVVPGESWKWMLAAAERRTLACADTRLAMCEDTRVSLIREYDLPAASIALMPPVFPVEAWAAQESPRTPGLCVYVGRLDRRKGVDTVLSAWPNVVKAHPHARLILVGEGNGVVPMLQFLSAHHSVSHHASLPADQLRALVASADLALCPAYLEGFGLSAAEAMACGTVVLAADSEGLRSLVSHEETGFLAPAGDSAAWARMMVRHLAEPGSHAHIGEAAKRSVRARFDRAMLRDRWVALLRPTTPDAEASSAA